MGSVVFIQTQQGYVAYQFKPGHDNNISVRDAAKHTRLQSKMFAGYLGKENDNLLSRLDENIMKFVKLIDDKYVTTGAEFKPMDIGRKAQYFTIDVVSTLAFDFEAQTQPQKRSVLFSSISQRIPRP
ncbi:hypothetical protein NA56DRAFT_712990 [Hyaloscypha hepaticicola]|uniref:Uncharacterized protein n=1 Tax=Hyaloscypha hepaticicola TaxID=2082293 RepID=A0A2J6PEX8_9HELO|nr:hypothetical protein NA56DRAFT_712990 [Hyaloscypha hepaticicola]